MCTHTKKTLQRSSAEAMTCRKPWHSVAAFLSDGIKIRRNIRRRKRRNQCNQFHNTTAQPSTPIIARRLRSPQSTDSNPTTALSRCGLISKKIEKLSSESSREFFGWLGHAKQNCKKEQKEIASPNLPKFDQNWITCYHQPRLMGSWEYSIFNNNRTHTHTKSATPFRFVSP